LARALSQAALGSSQCSTYSQADLRGLFFRAGRRREEKGDKEGMGEKEKKLREIVQF